MIRRFLFLIPVILLTYIAPARQSMNIMFYNTENLFDPADDPARDDDDFTPDGDYHWTIGRYRDKLDALAKVVAAADDNLCPALVGLCEVENDRVMTDLTARSALRQAGYRYVMTDSPDRRGIDVALMYRRADFKLLSHCSLRISLNGGNKATRDVLHVTGLTACGDTLDVYVCHWPSRTGGESETERFRLEAARAVRASADSVFAARRKPYVIIMGDFNEGPGCQAVASGLGAKPFSQGSSLADCSLVTLMDSQSDGSYRYDGYWDCYDQFVVSASLLNGQGNTSFEEVKVMRRGFLLEDDNRYGGVKPYRTYNGRRYQGGFSDHLPILLRLSY